MGKQTQCDQWIKLISQVLGVYILLSESRLEEEKEYKIEDNP